MLFKRTIFVVLLILMGFSASAQSNSSLKTRPTGHHILRTDVLQILINEFRLAYEIPVHKMNSIEVGAGFIYPNPLLEPYDLFSDFYQSTGGSVLVGYKFYPKVGRNVRIFPMQSYLNAQLFASQSSYSDRWFSITYPETSVQDEWHQISSNFTQAGFRALIGWQNRKGRLVTDLYFGLGVKMVITEATTHVITPGGAEPMVRPSSTFPETTSSLTDFTATPHLGLKLGIRTKGR